MTEETVNKLARDNLDSISFSNCICCCSLACEILVVKRPETYKPCPESIRKLGLAGESEKVHAPRQNEPVMHTLEMWLLPLVCSL